MKTIKELSSETGISTQYLRKIISKEPLRSQLTNHMVYGKFSKGMAFFFDETGESIIKVFLGCEALVNNTEDNVYIDVIKKLLEHINELQKKQSQNLRKELEECLNDLQDNLDFNFSDVFSKEDE